MVLIRSFLHGRLPRHLTPAVSGGGQERDVDRGKPTALSSVRFRVKAPVTRRPPHRSGREGFPHPVPQSPQASANGEPNRRHPVWRITLLSLALLDAVNDPGLRKRLFMTQGLVKFLPVYAALVAASAQPVLPSTLGMLEDHCKHLEIATYTIVLVLAPQFRT